jgi:hypothetical protein
LLRVVFTVAEALFLVSMAALGDKNGTQQKALGYLVENRPQKGAAGRR